jgi:hypothetical protein
MDSVNELLSGMFLDQELLNTIEFGLSHHATSGRQLYWYSASGAAGTSSRLSEDDLAPANS